MEKVHGFVKTDPNTNKRGNPGQNLTQAGNKGLSQEMKTGVARKNRSCEEKTGVRKKKTGARQRKTCGRTSIYKGDIISCAAPLFSNAREVSQRDIISYMGAILGATIV